MDLAWRAVLTFLLQGRSAQLRCAVDEEGSRLCIQDDATPESAKRLRMWAKLLQDAGPESAKQSVQQAIDTRDPATLKQRIRTTLHYCCTRIRIVSQDHSPHSVHVVWYSSIYNANNVPVCTYGQHANYDRGLTLLISVHKSVASWLAHSFLFQPSLVKDDNLFADECRQLQTAVHGMLTPLKRPDELDGMTGKTIESPTKEEELITCQTCLSAVPFSMILFVEACGHCICFSCATACAQKHLAAPNSTPCNMPCPAEGCSASLYNIEVKALLSADEYTDLEYNEVRLALRENCAICPKCSCTFERFHTDTNGDDPLRERLVCGACGTDFCVRCGAHPFHEGKPCREGGGGSAPECRYCGNPAVQFNPDVCDNPECLKKGHRACTEVKSCGHLCHGTRGERHCVSCLVEDCEHRHPQHCEDDFCAICYTDTLRDAPCIELGCGHIFHIHCIEEKLKKRWPTARIGFGFLECPLCGVEMSHHLINKEIAEIHKIRDKLEARYVDRLRLEKMLDIPELTEPTSRFYQKPIDFGRENLNYYMCSKCDKPYFGGLRRCQDVDAEPVDRKDLICGGCSAGSATCEIHGNQYMEYKCKYCCNTAVWFCWGTTHFCELCHSPPRRTVREECPGEERCPLGGRHPPNGTEFAIGCAMCRSNALVTDGSNADEAVKEDEDQ